MKKSPLNPWHERLGARMMQASGWSIPHTFSSLIEEHLAARSACALFDISHMSKFRVRGNGALEWLEKTLSQKVADCQDGAAQHTLLMDDEGKIIDKMTLLRESAGDMLLLGHAAVEEVAEAWLSARKPHAALELRNETDAWCGMALMGPQCEQVLSRVLRGSVELPGMSRFTRFFYQNHELILGRLGLEDEEAHEHAYEFFCPAVSGISWFESFMGAGAQPCGAATRESLRLERGSVAVGKEINRRTTPGEVRLDGLCCGEKGRPDAKPPRETVVRLRCTQGSHTTPEPGSSVRDSVGNTIGRITSASFSPALNDVVAMALLATPFVQPGMQLVIMVQGQAVPAVVM